MKNAKEHEMHVCRMLETDSLSFRSPSVDSEVHLSHGKPGLSSAARSIRNLQLEQELLWNLSHALCCD